MAITNPDGSIILDTKVDTTGINKGIASMRGSMTRLAATIGLAFSVTALVRFGKEAVKLASDLEEVQNVVDVSFGNMSYKIEEFSKTCIENFGLSELTAKQLSSTMLSMGKSMGQSLDLGSDKAIELTGRLADVASFRNLAESDIATLGSAIYTGETEPLKRIGIMMTEANLQLFTMEKGYKTLYKDMDAANKLLVRQEYFLARTSDAAGDYIRTQDGWANQTRTLSERWKEVKIQFGETFKAVGTLVLPVVNAVITGLGYIAQLLQSLASGVYKLFTGQELFAKETETAKDQISGAVGEQEELTEEIENSKKAQDKFLAGFDDLQKASANLSESFEDAGLDTSFESSVPQLNLGEGKGTNELEKKKNDIIRILGEMGGYIAGALVAIGLILLVSGQIPWGLGFILAGAVTYEVSKVAEKSGYDTKEVTKALEDMTPTIAGALVAIGLILLFLSQIGWGIGFIIAGATVFSVTQQAWKDDDSSVRSVEDKLAIIGEAVSVGLVGIGVMLIFFGNVALGLGFIVGGYHLLKISEQKLSESSIETDIKEWVNANYDAIQAMGSLLIILGVLVMAFSKTHFLKGVSMLIAGVALKYTAAAINQEGTEMESAFTTFVEKNLNLIEGSAAMLLIIGIVLLTMGKIALGAKLVAAGAGAIALAEEVTSESATTSLLDYLKVAFEFLYVAIPQLLVNILIGVGNIIIEGVNMIARAVNAILPESLEFGEISQIPEVDWINERLGFTFKEIIGFGPDDVAPFGSKLGSGESGSVAHLSPSAEVNPTLPPTTPIVIEVDGRELGKAVIATRDLEYARSGAGITSFSATSIFN